MAEETQTPVIPPPIPFEHGGKTYRVSFITDEVLAGFESWLKRQALAQLTALREALPPADYAREMHALIREIAAGELSVRGRPGRDAMATPDGALTLVSLLFGCPREEALAVAAARPDEVKAILERILAEWKARLGVAEGKGPEPAAPTPAVA